MSKPKKKIALVVVDRKDVPGWVFPELDKLNVDFSAVNCGSREELIAVAGDAFLIWTMGYCPYITPDLLPELSCKYIMRSGSGLDSLPVKEAAERGIIITNTPESIANSVAEHAVALLLALSRRIVNYDRQVKTGGWELNRDWQAWHISNQTLGLVGFGCIARKVAAFMRGFGGRIIVHDPLQSPEWLQSQQVIPVDMDTLLAESDFISVHCPLTEATRHLFGEKEFSRMKKSALLVNTSRGAVLDERALYPALRDKQIAGAAVDVTEMEPPSPENPLLQLDNFIVTPHIAAWDDMFDENYWRGSVIKIGEIMATS